MQIDLPTLLKAFKIDFVREYKFHEKRKYRFDIAIPEYKIAIEYEGGTYSDGRHSRPKGYRDDCRKYNMGQLQGWIILRYTVDDLTKNQYQIIEDIQSAMRLRGEK